MRVRRYSEASECGNVILTLALNDAGWLSRVGKSRDLSHVTEHPKIRQALQGLSNKMEALITYI